MNASHSPSAIGLTAYFTTGPGEQVILAGDCHVLQSLVDLLAIEDHPVRIHLDERCWFRIKPGNVVLEQIEIVPGSDPLDIRVQQHSLIIEGRLAARQRIASGILTLLTHPDSEHVWGKHTHIDYLDGDYEDPLHPWAFAEKAISLVVFRAPISEAPHAPETDYRRDIYAVSTADLQEAARLVEARLSIEMEYINIRNPVIGRYVESYNKQISPTFRIRLFWNLDGLERTALEPNHPDVCFLLSVDSMLTESEALRLRSTLDTGDGLIVFLHE